MVTNRYRRIAARERALRWLREGFVIDHQLREDVDCPICLSGGGGRAGRGLDFIVVNLVNNMKVYGFP